MSSPHSQPPSEAPSSSAPPEETSPSPSPSGDASREPPHETASNPGAGIDFSLFLDCVHCGLCTAACPTYAELGDENDSPRGRIYLMRAVTENRLTLNHEVRRHLELCLDCRACETACPSGVQYGKLIEPFRIAMEQVGDGPKKTDDWFHRWILFGAFPYPDRLRKLLWPARLAQRLGLMRLAESLRLTRLLPVRIQQLVAMLPPPRRRERDLPIALPAIGPCRARVALFTGCVGDVMFRHVHWATIRVLQQNGCEVVIPKEQACCGAIHYHAGVGDPARELADRNIEAFDRDDIDAVIVNVAGCGAMLKDYHHLPIPPEHADRVRRFRDKVRDINEFLAELGPVPPKQELRMKATYHDACHLCHAQQVRSQPRQILELIPGLELVPLAESDICCGAAGTYNLTEPEMAEQMYDQFCEQLRATGPTVATGRFRAEMAVDSVNDGPICVLIDSNKTF